MGSLHLTLCTGLLTAVTALTPLTAHAAEDTGGTVSVSPESPAPGGDIALRLTGCDGGTATAVSAAFVSEARLTGSGGTVTGETRIRTSLKVGAYAVRITCGDRTARGNIRVAEHRADTGTDTDTDTDTGTGTGTGTGGRTDTDSGTDTRTDTGTRTDTAPDSATAPHPSTPPSPTAPVRAGGGGTSAHAHLTTTAADADREGPGTAHAITGLLLAGAAAVAVILRGARKSRRTR
ncbi:hypothetical protein ACFRI7_08675 [Streptomyces sp. NPDC056716]|uniref:hypothetical protein n=1 Tax=unclassified Streptomyces TaxID=2593676 RepID=UPI0036AAA598